MTKNVSAEFGIVKPAATLGFEIAFLLLIAIPALIGNVLVITVIYKSRRVQWLTNLFVAQLAGSNLLVPLLCAPIFLDWSIEGSWMVGTSLCKLVHFAHHLNSGVSVFMITCMALDRYYVIVHPLSLHMGRSQTFQLIMVGWMFCILASVPVFYFYNTWKTTSGMHCTFPENSKPWKSYITAFTIVMFVIPIGVTTILFAIVVRTIKERNTSETYPLSTVFQVPSCNQRILGKVPKTKQKVVKMLIIQSLFFLICWLPFFARECIESWFDLRSRHFMVLSYWLAFSNSACSPILYTVTNSNFRRGCKHLCSLHVSKPYALSHVMNRKHQVDVFQWQSNEPDAISMAKNVGGERLDKNDSVVKLFEASSQSDVKKIAWEMDTHKRTRRSR